MLASMVEESLVIVLVLQWLYFFLNERVDSGEVVDEVLGEGEVHDGCHFGCGLAVKGAVGLSGWSDIISDAMRMIYALRIRGRDAFPSLGRGGRVVNCGEVVRSAFLGTLFDSTATRLKWQTPT